ncbi:MAG TPA: MFS transporter [Caulobacteraceae bacterium]|nr:MFS transporter [Caulobacteraceae bacterium]
MAAVAVEAEARSAPNGFARAAVLVVVGIMSTTLAQDGMLARLPIQNLLKNELHEPRSATAAFFFLSGLAWYFKPLAGILTDAFPVFGSRRRTYLVGSAVVGTLIWLAVSLIPHQYAALAGMMVLLSVFMMLASTVIGAVLVETAHATGASGRLTALRFAVQYLCAIGAALVGGYLATIWFGWVAIASAAILFLIVPVAFATLHEPRVTADASEILAGAKRQLQRILAARTMWAAGGLVALFYIAPGFTTALFYKQQSELHMAPPAQGVLNMIAAVGAIAGVLSYAALCRSLRLRTLLFGCLSLATLTTLGYLFYSSVLEAQIVEAVHGFGAAVATTALVDLSVRATPAGSEGLGYALMISISNFARFGTDWMGSLMLDHWHLPFSDLVLANAATTLIAVPFVALLPKMLVMPREAEARAAS